MNKKQTTREEFEALEDPVFGLRYSKIMSYEKWMGWEEVEPKSDKTEIQQLQSRISELEDKLAYRIDELIAAKSEKEQTETDYADALKNWGLAVGENKQLQQENEGLKEICKLIYRDFGGYSHSSIQQLSKLLNPHNTKTDI